MAIEDYGKLISDPMERMERVRALHSTINPFWYCPIDPWVAELQSRFGEAVAGGQGVVNLSYTHPRGFFPNPILHRRPVRDILREAERQGWKFDKLREPPVQFPNVWFLPVGWPPTALSEQGLEQCATRPFEAEIELRVREAGRGGFVDLTSFHPRGGIHPHILKRIERRKDAKWREQMELEIASLRGSANKDEALAATHESKIEAQKTKPDGTGDPTALINSVRALRERAAASRSKAKALEQEMEGT